MLQSLPGLWSQTRVSIYLNLSLRESIYSCFTSTAFIIPAQKVVLKTLLPLTSFLNITVHHQTWKYNKQDRLREQFVIPFQTSSVISSKSFTISCERPEQDQSNKLEQRCCQSSCLLYTERLEVLSESNQKGDQLISGSRLTSKDQSVTDMTTTFMPNMTSCFHSNIKTTSASPV